MTRTNINFAAVRAFNRVWHPLACQLEEAACADEQFDWGEYSGGFHADTYEKEFDACIARVAKRFGMPARQLYRDVNDAPYYELEQMTRAKIDCGYYEAYYGF